MDEIDMDDLCGKSDTVNNPHEDERRASEEFSNDGILNWDAFLLEGVVDRSSDESDYAPSEFPLSDSASDLIVDDERYGMTEFEEESNEEQMEDYGIPEIDSSDDELQTARKRVQEYREQVEKEIEAQLSEYEDSDGDVHVVFENEDDDNAEIWRKRRRKMAVGVGIDYKKFVWEVGMRFPNMTMFKEHTRKYGIFNGYSLSFVVCDKQRVKVGVMCKEGCPFKIYASRHHKEGCLLVKSVKNEHTCVRDMQRNRQLTSKWLAKQYLGRFKINSNRPAEDMMDSVRSRYGVIINRWIAYKAKAAALKMLHGSVKQHYDKLGRYIEELKSSNKGSTFQLLTIPSTPPIFQRLFICYESLKNGQIRGCRPFICLDGCHLKTFLGGILLAAVGRDGNNQMGGVDGSCTCRKWDVTGIPCHHGVAALSFLKVAPEDYVNNYYRKESYLRAYEGSITPCVSEKFWPKVNFPLDPPPLRNLPGRPKKNRRKDPHEDPKKQGKLTKHGVQMTCSVCKSTEHNKRKCPNLSNSRPSAERRSRGRPRKHPMQTVVGEPSGDVVAGRGRGRGIGRGRGRLRGIGRGGGGGVGLAARGMGIIYDERGSILHSSSASGHVFVYHQGDIGPSQVSQERGHSAPFMDGQT